MSFNDFLGYILNSFQTVRMDSEGRMDELYNRGFDKGIKIGQLKTITALLSVGKDYNSVISIMKDCWEIPTHEIENLIQEEKIIKAINRFVNYLKLQENFTDSEVMNYFEEYSVESAFYSNKILLDLNKTPQDIKRIIEDLR